MPHVKVGGRQINGVDTEIYADSDGAFLIKLKDETKAIGSGTTLDAAVTMARNAINRDKTAVSIKFITKGAGESGVATGFHSRNRTVLARIEGGKGEQLDYNYKAFRADIPKDKLERYLAIRDELIDLKREQQDIERDYEITLRESVQQAITDAQGKTLAGATTQVAARRSTRRRY